MTFRRLRAFIFIAIMMIGGGARSRAQVFGLGASASANSLQVSNSLTYTMNVTNQSGFPLADLLVTNTFSGSFQFISATGPQGTYTNYNNLVVFNIGNFPDAGVALLTLTLAPLAAGSLTNQIVVSAIDFTNTVTTDLITTVTNPPPAIADLAVALLFSATTVITNDLLTYQVTVTNGGPDTATGVSLTNTLPPGVNLESVSPTTGYSQQGSNLIFNLGTLTNGSFNVFHFFVEPVTAGNLIFSAAVAATGATDPNPANNTASTNITVTGYLPGDLVAVTNSAQIVNRQNGLIEQSILVSNLGTNNVAAVRVVVTGLTNRLFNASGTNNGNPFVVYAATLTTNQSVNLLLQYAPRLNFPFTNGQLQAYAVPVPNLTPPPVSSVSTNLVISQIVPLANGNMLIVFPSTLGRTYTVVYSDNLSFSNAMIAPPSVVAPGDVSEWIDYGPPTTTSAPTTSPARFYRVIQNP